jgi:hypothetical protein
VCVYVCVCARVCVCVRARAFVCVCVCARARGERRAEGGRGASSTQEHNHLCANLHIVALLNLGLQATGLLLCFGCTRPCRVPGWFELQAKKKVQLGCQPLDFQTRACYGHVRFKVPPPPTCTAAHIIHVHRETICDDCAGRCGKSETRERERGRAREGGRCCCDSPC